MSASTSRSGRWFSAAALLAGARAILPLSVGAFAFGMAYGVSVTELSINDLVGALASLLMLAGAAQLAVVDLVDQGAPWFVVVGTALVINARFMMYSGALAPSFSEYPRRWRVALSYFMTDQATVTSLLYNERQREPRARMAYYLGAGLCFAVAWWIGTAIGVGIGATVPSEFQVGFAVPLMFVALVVPSINYSRLPRGSLRRVRGDIDRTRRAHEHGPAHRCRDRHRLWHVGHAAFQRPGPQRQRRGARERGRGARWRMTCCWSRSSPRARWRCAPRW